MSATSKQQKRSQKRQPTWLDQLDKQCFENMRDLSIGYHKIKSVFDGLVEKRFGYHYSDRDIDEIIDVLDYGDPTEPKLTYERFVKLIENKKPSETDN